MSELWKTRQGVHVYLLETIGREVEVEAHPRQRQHQFVYRSVRIVVFIDLFGRESVSQRKRLSNMAIGEKNALIKNCFIVFLIIRHSTKMQKQYGTILSLSELPPNARCKHNKATRHAG